MHNTMYGQNTFTVVSDALIRDRDWVHLAVTYNATTYVSTVYINAIEVGSSQGSLGMSQVGKSRVALLNTVSESYFFIFKRIVI